MINAHTKKTLVVSLLNRSHSVPQGELNSMYTKFTSEYRNSEPARVKWRPETSWFMDYGYWFGMTPKSLRNKMMNINPSLKDVIDFCMYDHVTSMGSNIFTTIFLREGCSKYGITKDQQGSLLEEIKDEVGDLGYALLIDTVNFVMTGHRDIPISTIVSYMDDDVSTEGFVVREKFDRDELYMLDEAEFLSRWLATEDGISDCVEIQRLIFNIGK